MEKAANHFPVFVRKEMNPISICSDVHRLLSITGNIRYHITSQRNRMGKCLFRDIETDDSLTHCTQIQRFTYAGQTTEIIGFGNILSEMPGIDLTIFQRIRK